MPLLPWQNATVEKIETIAKNTIQFTLRTDENEVFDFKPGQFVTFDLPIHESKNKRLRSYSIASAPTNNNKFELCIVLAENGLGTNYLFNEIKIGSSLTFRGALGHFVLPENIEEDIYFISTGTGIAPFRSMIHYVFKNDILHNKLNVIFGCRTKQDLLYYDEFVQYEKTAKSFNYFPTLSRENWEGKTGYVHDIYETLIAEKGNKGLFYLCGWKNMIDDAREKLLNLGVEKNKIIFELYG